MPPLKSGRMFLLLARITLVLLYLVILAGSTVRATGSGMGCPDWPRCFGYYIPPTDPSQVQFQPGHAYRRSSMIIANDVLWRARTDFVSGSEFDASLWEQYPEHDYAEFHVAHTWTEYVNRLMGATSGMAMAAMGLLALMRLREDRKTVLAMLFGLGAMAFVIWLGAVVVQTKLAPFKISLHMLSAMIIVAVVIYVQARTSALLGQSPQPAGKLLRSLLVLGLLLTLTQVIVGTQVRQQIDAIAASTSDQTRETWIAQLGSAYLWHRIGAAAALLTSVTAGVFLYKRKPKGVARQLAIALMVITPGVYGIGILMHQFGIPAFIQPVHLLLAMILFGVQIGLLLRVGEPRGVVR